MRILQVNTLDDGGGAAKVARSLFEAYRLRGHDSWMAVALKRTEDADIFQIQQASGARVWARPWWQLHDRLRPLSGRAVKVAHAAAQVASPGKLADELRGIENFEFPGSLRLLDLPPDVPDVVHLHNLHGEYFDLRLIESMSRTVPVVLTLHDTWMLTGHCAYFLDCNRWTSGCGSCPYPDVYPPVRRDSTDVNWLRKKRIYEKSTLFVAAPSRWLLKRAERSILADAITEARLIPNGVDLSVFQPGEQAAARSFLGLPRDGRVLLFSGFSPASSSFKDLATLRAAAEILGQRPDVDRITLLVLGEKGESITAGRVTIRFPGYENDDAKVARFYQAADVYVHAARTGGENHSLSVLEALACGIPVVATDVGGIPEQIKSLPSSDPGHATGVLTPAADPVALADAVSALLANRSLLGAMANNAAEDARRRFDLERQVSAYLDWYGEMTDASVRSDTT